MRLLRATGTPLARMFSIFGLDVILWIMLLWIIGERAKMDRKWSICYYLLESSQKTCDISQDNYVMHGLVCVNMR